MPSNKNKFNTSKNTQGWFPFAKYLFVTDNHPIRQSKDKCSSSIEALFSQQELEQINGITNSLQCETKDAIRIALYETCKDAHTAYEKTYIKAKSASTVKGHEGRKTEKRLTLPLSEKQAALDAAKQLNITIKEFLRLAVIWIADGIKEESITSLTNSKRIGKDAVAKQWSRENRDKPPSESVKKLKEAQRDAEALWTYEDDLERAHQNELYPSIGNRLSNELVRQEIEMMDIERSAGEDSWFFEHFDDVDSADGIEILVREMMRRLDVDYEIAKLMVQDELDEQAMLMKMSSKEKLEFLKKKNAPSEEEILRAERRKQHEINHQKWKDDYEAYQQTFPKTWRGYVQKQRLEKPMIGIKEPFPDIPNPIPDDYPMPEGWDESKVWWEVPLKDARD
jgi:hypothetical protein